MKLAVDGVTFDYGTGQNILEGMSFTYESPDIMCLLGCNGVGKSTLLKCIMGELSPASGTITIDGKPTRQYSPRDMALKVAYIAQMHAPTFSYPVIDVVTMGRTSHIGYLSNPSDEDVQFAYDQLVYLGIERLAERPYTEISGGERQLVMIASALAQQPEAMLLDEPTAHLDFGNQFKFVQLVERLHAKGIGVLMTTHFPDHALLLDCETAILSKGGVVAQGPAHKVVTEEALGQIYGIPINIAPVGSRKVCVPGDLDDPLGRIEKFETGTTKRR
ncbi:MAG: ABC transporter ATP-binding protein [Coriobacteriales bacterium]|nr:ABC transporter ATP-binding protein [Coriobacteriales bacterium]